MDTGEIALYDSPSARSDEFRTTTGFVTFLNNPAARHASTLFFGAGAERNRRNEGVDVIYMKACPKCAGDVELAAGQDGAVLQCLQCSFTVDSPAAARRAVAERAKNTVAA